MVAILHLRFCHLWVVREHWRFRDRRNANDAEAVDVELAVTLRAFVICIGDDDGVDLVLKTVLGVKTYWDIVALRMTSQHLSKG